mmetsp:Transcript_47264/g.113386  ORF Transcript_47264/g.113386 Transcript_47264/m.113386 type:complete len:281 (-) Transcript_47264:775-1617(-)
MPASCSVEAKRVSSMRPDASSDISATSSSFFIGMGSRTPASTPATSATLGTPSWPSAAVASVGVRGGTCSETLKTSSSSSCSSTEAEEEVPMTTSLWPTLGAFLTQTSSVCSTTLLKRGPMRTYSSSRSRSSSTMRDIGLLCASSKVLAMSCALLCSPMPIMLLGETSLQKALLLSRASCAASAVLPVPGGPSSMTDSSEVTLEECSCEMRLVAVATSRVQASLAGRMPPRTHACRSSLLTPKAGMTSVRPRRKSFRPTLRPVRSIFLRLSPPPVVRARA